MKNLAFVILTVIISCNQPKYKNPHIRIITGFGKIDIELYPEKAPATVDAFLSAIDSGSYKHGSFYRVLKADELPTSFNSGLIQGGIYLNKAAPAAKRHGITHESTKLTGLSHTDGTISMARTDTGTATTEFFICIGDQSPLDAGRRGTPDGFGYAAFGKVVKGMDVVRRIQEQESNGDRLIKMIEIKNMERL